MVEPPAAGEPEDRSSFVEKNPSDVVVGHGAGYRHSFRERARVGEYWGAAGFLLAGPIGTHHHLAPTSSPLSHPRHQHLLHKHLQSQLNPLSPPLLQHLSMANTHRPMFGRNATSGAQPESARVMWDPSRGAQPLSHEMVPSPPGFLSV